MEETKSFWDKTANELTVKDQFVIAGATFGACIAVMGLASASTVVADKFREFRANRKNKNN